MTASARKPVVLCLTEMHESGMSLLRERTELRMASGTDPATLAREIPEAEGLVIRTSGVVDAALLDAAPRLKVIGRHGVGFDHVDVPAATARGVQVVYTPGANVEAVVEHTFALMIGVSKHFPKMLKAVAEFRHHDRTSVMGRDIRGRTLGIVGFGRIGKQVGRVAYQAFGMKVLYNDIVPIAPEDEQAAGARRVSLEELLAESEYVRLHVPLDASTRRMIHDGRLARMRPDAILINTCRGAVVDEAAVARALDEKRLWGYGADVYELEPPPRDHPLIGRDDCMLTPHCAAQTIESLINMASWSAQGVVDVLEGRPPKYPVNDPAEVMAARRRLGKV